MFLVFIPKHTIIFFLLQSKLHYAGEYFSAGALLWTAYKHKKLDKLAKSLTQMCGIKGTVRGV